MQNKWWDGYQGQKIVVLDEFGKDHVVLGNHLKKWADPWTPFVAEAKGGALTPDYDKFIVTSNYSLEELFGNDPAVLEPLRRRFTVVHFDGLQAPPGMRGPTQRADMDTGFGVTGFLGVVEEERLNILSQ